MIDAGSTDAGSVPESLQENRIGSQMDICAGDVRKTRVPVLNAFNKRVVVPVCVKIIDCITFVT